MSEEDKKLNSANLFLESSKVKKGRSDVAALEVSLGLNEDEEAEEVEQAEEENEDEDEDNTKVSGEEDGSGEEDDGENDDNDDDNGDDDHDDDSDGDDDDGGVNKSRRKAKPGEDVREPHIMYIVLNRAPTYGIHAHISMYHTLYDALLAKWSFIRRWASEGAGCIYCDPPFSFDTWEYSGDLGSDPIASIVERVDSTAAGRRDDKSFFFMAVHA